MDKRTIIAVVISVVIISASFILQSVFFPNTMPQRSATSASAGSGTRSAPAPEPSQPAAEAPVAPAAGGGEITAAPEAAQPASRDVEVSTALFDARFSSRGAVMTSLKLKQFQERDGSPVEMVISGDSGLYPFRTFLDGVDTGNDTFRVVPSVLSGKVEFERDYVYRQGGRSIPFTLRKSFVFKESDYMMEFRIAIDAEDREQIPIKSYQFIFGPQIGPEFTKLDGRTAYRRMIYYADGKRKDYSSRVKQSVRAVEDRASWVAIEGKYFIVAGVSYVSDLSAYEVGFDGTPDPGLPERKQNSIYYRREIGQTSAVDEGYKFYVGPKKREVLELYNDKERNEWRESGLHLEEAVASSFWGWLSNALKWLLEFYYRLIPNWGVAIILLTLTIKIIFFPLTRKSFESTSKMQALGPKLNAIKEKYKDNPQKMNQETAALYKKEGVNPLGGCLPMLLQLPIFLALYRLFNGYFELRGAPFIRPWIPDLSGPEQFLKLPFSIPFLGDTLNLLPFLMLGMTFLQQKVSQTPTAQTSSQSKMLLYGMPLFFFFIMYNMPSGLLLYWTMQSLVSFVQQFYINHLRDRSGTGDKR